MLTLPNLTTQVVADSLDLGSGFYTITPEDAEALLALNVTNRKISPTNSLKLIQDIKDGAFVLNGESVIFSNEGRLLDGQHRLRGCVEAGVPIQTLVAFGIAPKRQDTMDAGASRALAHVLDLKGVKNSTTVVTISRAVLASRRSGGRLMGHTASITTPQVISLIAERPDIIDIAAWANTFKEDLVGLCPLAVLGIARALAEPYFGERAVEFLERLARGDELAQDHPAFIARRVLRGMNKRSNFAATEVILRALVRHAQGQNGQKIRVKGEFPSAFWSKEAEGEA